MGSGDSPVRRGVTICANGGDGKAGTSGDKTLPGFRNPLKFPTGSPDLTYVTPRSVPDSSEFRVTRRTNYQSRRPLRRIHMKSWTGNTRLRVAQGWAVSLVCGLSAMVGLAGCSTTTPGVSKNAGDPLLGDPLVPPKGGPATTSSIFKPAVPRDGNTPAALVSHTQIPGLTGSKPLTLDAGWQRDYGKSSSGPKVTPVPFEKTGPAPVLIPTSGTWTPEGKVAPIPPLGSDPLTPLRSLGAIGIRQEATASGVYLSCFLPGAEPGNLRFVEVSAATLPQAVDAITPQVR